MTRKDYVLIADLLKSAYYLDESQLLTLAKDFADELSMTNPRFDRARFIAHATMTDARKNEVLAQLNA